EFLYITDLSAAKLTEVTDNCVYFDPSQHDILHGIYEDSKPKTLNCKCYTSSQQANEIHLHCHQQLHQCVKAGYQGGIIQTMEDLLAEGMQCTTTYPCEFEEYVAKWAHVFLMLNNFYARYRTHHTSEYWPEGQPFHCHLHSCTYMQQQQADQCLVKSIIGGRNPKPAVKKCPEVWCNGLLRCTSKECISWVMQNSGRKAHEPEWVTNGRYWNRDMAAALNFRCIVHSLVVTHTIPKPFRRNSSHTPGSDDDTPAADNGTGSDDDDVAAQTQHRYPTRRRTGRTPTDNVQQQ
ncbi:hypothetical protein GGI22_007185, partial [Coemansia erecta]